MQDYYFDEPENPGFGPVRMISRDDLVLGAADGDGAGAINTALGQLAGRTAKNAADIKKHGTWPYDSSADYAPPAIVSDEAGNLYACVAENGTGTAAGVQPLTNSGYWTPILTNNKGLRNTREVITESGEWIAPVTGWYKITCIGGGGGGSGGILYAGFIFTGGGGGGGERKIFYAYLSKGEECPVAIGAGGIGGAADLNSYPSAAQQGLQGGSTQITIRGTAHSAQGGYGAGDVGWNTGGHGGGSGESKGEAGVFGLTIPSVHSITLPGGKGGNCGASFSEDATFLLDAENAGYGAGGIGGISGNGGTITAGTNGTQGCIIAEYCDAGLAH